MHCLLRGNNRLMEDPAKGPQANCVLRFLCAGSDEERWEQAVRRLHATIFQV